MSYQNPNQGYYQAGQSGQGYQQQPTMHHQGTGQPPRESGAWHASDSGSFQGGTYQISHRDTNSILSVNLSHGGSIKSRPGAMIEMAGTIKLEGKSKFSMKKLVTGESFHESVYSGSGALTLAPVMLGDIATLQLDGSGTWLVSRDAYLAGTLDLQKDIKSQGVGKALFSGEDIFVLKVSGTGLMWVSSFGAITRRDIPAGQTHIVDNGHLVAWNCEYKIQKAGGGMFTSMKTGEGAVCQFTGPGTVYIQTRNFEEFAIAVCEKVGVPMNQV